MWASAMPLVHVEDIADERLDDYRSVPDPELLKERGVFVAEGRLVVRALLAGGRFAVRSLLVTSAALEAMRDLINPAATPLPVYLGTKELMSRVIGFNVHRGCLGIGERPAPVTLDGVIPAGNSRSLVLALESIANADNVGGIFRNSVAFGADAVLLAPGCADPLYRKTIRVSIGGSLTVPFARLPDWPSDLSRLQNRGYAIIALTPNRGAIDIGEFACSPDLSPRIVLLVGSEGGGLTKQALASADVRVRIPMVSGVDSLNVATAVGIALHRLTDEAA